MSHFVGLCFGEYFECHLERYYEGNDVEEYVDYTKEEAIAEIKKDRPDISDEEAWEYIKESWGYTINEKDELVSTYNPESKWDWYCVGGRWSKYLPMAEFDENDNIYIIKILLLQEKLIGNNIKKNTIHHFVLLIQMENGMSVLIWDGGE